MTPAQTIQVDETEDVINQIIGAVAALDDTPVSEPRVLNDVIDVDALAAIVTNGSPPTKVGFEYAGYNIVVKAREEMTATVSIEPP